MNNQPVVIIGGGFAGVYTARDLLRVGVPVVLISETNFFTFTPLLHEVATGSLVSHDTVFEYESFFKSPAFTFLRGRVERIDVKKKRVFVGEREVAYRALVVATGSTTQDYGMPGAELAYTLKHVDDAVRLKRAVLSRAQSADERVQVTVVGGGPTGVELAFDMAMMLAAVKKKAPALEWGVRLVHAKETFCRLDDDGIQGYIRRAMDRVGIEVVCGAKATGLKDGVLETTVREFDSDVTVMAAGVRPNTDVFADDLELDARGHVPVNASLQYVHDQHVFALGDIAAIDGEPIAKLAQTATREARVVAQNIQRMFADEALLTYEPKVIGMLFSLGFGDGIGRIGGRMIKGWFAWWLWRTVYLMKTPGFSNKLRVAFSWTLDLFGGRNLVEL